MLFVLSIVRYFLWTFDLEHKTHFDHTVKEWESHPDDKIIACFSLLMKFFWMSCTASQSHKLRKKMEGERKENSPTNKLIERIKLWGLWNMHQYYCFWHLKGCLRIFSSNIKMIKNNNIRRKYFDLKMNTGIWDSKAPIKKGFGFIFANKTTPYKYEHKSHSIKT